MSISTGPLPGTSIDPLYPDSDGEPMAETEFQLVAMVHLYEALKLFFAGRDDVHVASDMFFYYEQGNPAACRAPDVMVTKGVVGKHLRRSFRLWEEGVPPAVIFEVTSAKTQYEDQVEKPSLYAKLGVREYFLFDAEGVFLRPRLKGFRLEHGTYVPLKLDNAERMVSDELGLQLAIDGPLLRLTDLRTGNRLPTLQELAEKASKAENAKDRAEKATRRAEEARRRAEEATADEQREVEAQRKRVAELEAELARLRETQTPPGSH